MTPQIETVEQKEDLAHKINNYAALVFLLDLFLMIIVACATRDTAYEFVLIPQVVIFICSFIVSVISGAISETVDDDIRVSAQVTIALFILMVVVGGCALLGNFFHQLILR